MILSAESTTGHCCLDSLNGVVLLWNSRQLTSVAGDQGREAPKCNSCPRPAFSQSRYERTNLKWLAASMRGEFTIIIVRKNGSHNHVGNGGDQRHALHRFAT